jgi:endogenous inhibitor of DNA gyrase (YacG/DUF329 family)
MSPQTIKCPTCKRKIDWSTAQFRPFCSERCRLIDLGGWLSEKHVIPGEAVEDGSVVGNPPDMDSGSSLDPH